MIYDSRKFGTQDIEYYITGKLLADKINSSDFVREFSERPRLHTGYEDSDDGDYCTKPLTALKKKLVWRKKYLLFYFR